MSATMYPDHTIVRSTTRVDGPRYGVRRVVAAAVLALALVLLAVAASTLVGVVVDVGGRPAAASDVMSASDVARPRVHVAQSGDTLWSIADRYRGGVGQGRFVDALIDLNGGTTIQIGQAVRLP